jgi:hypothetical protein
MYSNCFYCRNNNKNWQRKISPSDLKAALAGVACKNQNAGQQLVEGHIKACVTEWQAVHEVVARVPSQPRRRACLWWADKPARTHAAHGAKHVHDACAQHFK